MQKEIEAFEARFWDLMISGDVPGLKEMFHLPVAIYTKDGIKVDVTSEELERGVSEVMAAVRRFGVVEAREKITLLPEQENLETISYDVDIRFFDSAGNMVREAKCRRFLETRESRLAISMVDIIESAFIGVHDAKEHFRPI